MEKVKIYCLFDPTECRIRYIGRTKKKVLEHRLIEHISKAKYYSRYYPNARAPYRINWINSVLDKGVEPKIRLLTEIEGWRESYLFERSLINKYKDKFNLVNLDDRGEGGKNRVVTEEERQKISSSLKKHFAKNPQKPKPVFVYTKSGEFYGEYKSNVEVAEHLNLRPDSISKCMRANWLDNIKGWQFSREKLDRMQDITKRVSKNCKKISFKHKYTEKSIEFKSIKEMGEHFRFLGIISKHTGIDNYIKSERFLPVLYLYDIYMNDELYPLPFRLETI